MSTIDTQRISSEATASGPLFGKVRSSGNRVIKPRRRSRNRQFGLGLLFVLLGAFAAGVSIQAAGHRQSVLAIGKPVAAHQVIQRGDLVSTRVAADSFLHPIAVGDAKSVIGKPAAVDLVPGTLLTHEQISNDPVLLPGTLALPLSLKPGQFPVGLRAGDHVAVMSTPTPNSAATSNTATDGAVLVADAEIYATATPDVSGNQTVTLVVSSDSAPSVSSAASQQQVTLALRAPQQ